MFKSFKKLSALLLGGALLAVGCATEGDIHKLNERIDQIVAGQIATIEKQIIALQNADKELGTTIQSEVQKVRTDLAVDIQALRDADTATNSKLDNATSQLTSAINAEKTQREQAIAAAKKEATDAIALVNQEITNLKLADKGFENQIQNLGSQITNNFNTLDQKIKDAEAAAKAHAEAQDLKLKTEVGQNLDNAVQALQTTITGVQNTLQEQINALNDNKADKDQVAKDIKVVADALEAADAAAKAAIKALQDDKADKTQVAEDIAKAAKDLQDAIDLAAGQAAAALAEAVAKIEGDIADYKAEVAAKIKDLEDADAAMEAAIKKLNEETIPGIEDQIEKLQNYVDNKFLTKEDFETYKEATRQTIEAINAAIDNLAETKLDKTVFNEKVDEIIAKFDDYVLKTTFNEFKDIAATKAELETAKTEINNRIDAVEVAYKKADDDLATAIETAEANAKQHAEDQDRLIYAAFKQADTELDEKYKGITDGLDSRLGVAEDAITALEEQKDLLWTAVNEALAAAQAVDTRLTNEVNDLKENVIPAAAAEALQAAMDYTDGEIAKVNAKIAEIQEALEFTQGIVDDLAWRLAQDEENLLMLASTRIQSITYVPDYDDMKVTMNVAYVVNGDAVLPIPELTEVTYKVFPTNVAEQLFEYFDYYEQYGKEYGFDGYGGYMAMNYFNFDVTDKLKTRDDGDEEEEEEEVIPHVLINRLKSYDADKGYLTLEVLPLGIVSEGFVANELTPIDAQPWVIDYYGTRSNQYNNSWVLYDLYDKEGNYIDYSNASPFILPVYDWNELMAYRARDSYAIALEFRKYDDDYEWEDSGFPGVTMNCDIWLIDWENMELEPYAFDTNSFMNYFFDDYSYYTPGENSISSAYNVLHPSAMSESKVIEILPDPYINDPDDPRADAKGWVNVAEETQYLPYNVASDSVEVKTVDGKEVKVYGTKVILQDAQPLVEYEGEKYAYDELFGSLLGNLYTFTYDYYPRLKDSKYTYAVGESIYSPVDEENFTEGSVDSQVDWMVEMSDYVELELPFEYLTLSMNDDKDLVDKKKAVGNKITGSYTWQPVVGDPFTWNGYVIITKSLYTSSATAHIDWTYAEDADVDHDRFYNRRDEEQYYYSREGIEVVFAEDFESDLAEKYGLTIADLFGSEDPAIISEDGATVNDGDATYKNSEANSDQAQFGLPFYSESKVWIPLDNFDFIPLPDQKTYIAKAMFSNSNVSLDMTLTVTTKDRDRTPMAFSFGETKVKLNDPEFYDVDNDYFTARSEGDKAADIMAKFKAQGIITDSDFASVEAFTNAQYGELRNEPLDKHPDAEEDDEAWFDIYKVYAETLEGALDSETLLEIDGQKQNDTRYSYIGQELNFDWTVSVDLPKYDYLHGSYYTFNAVHDNKPFIQQYDFDANDGSIKWWTQVNPSYFTEASNGQDDQNRVSFRHALAEYDVSYINIAELAFNIVDENDEVMDEDAIAEAQLISEFQYKDETLGAQELPIYSKKGNFNLYSDLWVNPLTYYYRTCDKKYPFMPVLGTLAIRSGNTDVLFPLPTRFDTPKPAVKYPDEVLDYSDYALVRWTPFKAPVAEGYKIVLDENKIYRVPLFKGMYLEDHRPNIKDSYYVIEDGEWVIGNVTEFDAEAGTYTEGGNGYIDGVAANVAYDITSNFVYDDIKLPTELKKLLKIMYYGPDPDAQPVGPGPGPRPKPGDDHNPPTPPTPEQEESEPIFISEDAFKALSADQQKEYIPYIVYDYTSEVEFRGHVDIPVVVTLNTPWQPAIDFKYTIEIEGVNYEQPAEPEEPAGDEPVNPDDQPAGDENNG